MQTTVNMTSKKRNEIRCSSLPRILACPASIDDPEIRIDAGSDAARIGTAFHAYMEQYIRGENTDMPSPGYFLRQEIQAPTPEQDEEMEYLVSSGERMWKEFEPHLLRGTVFVEKRIQRDLNDYSLTGRLDVWGMAEDCSPVVIDWKTGRMDHQYRAQLIGYASLLNGMHGEFKRLMPGAGVPSRYKIVTASVRFGRWDTEEVTQADIDGLHARISEIVSGARPYNPSAETCQYCPRAAECPARASLARAAVAVFTGVPIEPTPDSLGQVYEQSQMLAKALESYRDAVKNAVATFGSIPLPDGRKLVQKERTKETILFSNSASAVFADKLGADWQDQLPAGTVTVSKKPLLDLAAAQAGKSRGAGKAAKDALLEALRDQGCIEAKTYQVLEAAKN